MDSFQQRKDAALNSLAASERVGDADADVMTLLNAVNDHPSLYTTSSCSGRTVLMVDAGGKGENRFTAKWHRKVSFNEVSEALEASDGRVWFRHESPILHIVAKTPETASKVLHAAMMSGFKRSGIQSLKEDRVVVELVSTERVDAPVKDPGRLLVPQEYLRVLVDEANRKHETGLKKLKRLEQKIKGIG